MKNGLLFSALVLGLSSTTAVAQTPGSGFGVPRARAAEPVVVQSGTIILAPLQVVGGEVAASAIVEGAGEHVVVVHEEPNGAPAPRHRPLRKLLGCDCQGDFREFGCGSFHSEMTWMFGSCHTFFGVPCVPAPPHRWFSGGRRQGSGCDCK